MATQQHTPGPWTIGDSGLVYDDNGLETADSMGATPEERNANARLIAAAPDLLLALERTACALELAYSKKPLRDMAETLAEARAAIAKATQS